LFTLVEYASRRPDPHGQIRPVLAFFFVAVLLRWQERRQAARWWRGIFANKALPFFLRHPMRLHVSGNQIVELLLPGSRPWRTVKGGRKSGDGFLNKLIFWVRRRRHHQRSSSRVRGRFFGPGGSISSSRCRVGPATSSILPHLQLSLDPSAKVVTSRGICMVGGWRKWHRSSSEAILSSSTSAAILLAVIYASEAWRFFNLHRRPSQRLEVAFIVDFNASGAVPALKPDGGSLVSCSPVGIEKDLIAIFFFLLRSILHLPGTYVLFLLFMGSFVTHCTPTAWN
jgi:hypothetical protein